MRTITTTALIILTWFNASFGQDISGRWSGILDISTTKLEVVFNIISDGNSYSATMDSPNQGVMGIPATGISFHNDTLRIEIAGAKIEYKALFANNKFKGDFIQAGIRIPLNIEKANFEKPNRPQEPIAPYPYHTEDVRIFNSKANISLAGTLSLPSKDGKYPVAILISGSGPQNRDSEIMGHKPFLVIADYLTRNGIGVLRFDDRGVGESEGNFAIATTYDFADDVESAVTFLQNRKEVLTGGIGLIGHSEGGIIAPIVASRSKAVDFVVLLAGSGLKGDELMLLQKRLIEAQMGIPLQAIDYGQQLMKGAYNVIISSTEDHAATRVSIGEYFKSALGESASSSQVEGVVKQLSSPWMINFIRHDPTPYLKGVSCAVLALNGEKDLQVPPKENLAAIAEAIRAGGNAIVVTKEFPGLNHLFQECETGAVSEYAIIQQTFSPDVLKVIEEWIRQLK